MKERRSSNAQSFPRHAPSPACPPGTRTRVTGHFGKPELVVFCPFALKLLLDAVLLLPTPSPGRHLASPRSVLGCRFTRLFGLGRFLFECARRSHGKLLLRLLASQNLCGLRQNVRIAEIRFAVVGRDLQETSLQGPRRDARCWTARTSSRTFRARFHQIIPCGRLGRRSLGI
jgi:hypothetical protein